jgi:lipopolysaccharide transport system ATP-binding protein
MSFDLIISVKHLDKIFQIFENPFARLRQLFSSKTKRHYREFSAIRDLSFDLSRGETMGVIGRNGAGKSTLLQMICGTLTPTAGTISVNGKIAALLELGAGFNPEFTGRENVAIAAALYGLDSKKLRERLPLILAFADIGEFVDQPVKTYSSGMFVRLAFAVIAHVDADVLVVDEALAVGDIFFQQKCMRYLREFQARGGTMLFVSHDTAAVVNLCRYALWLKNPAAGEYVFGEAEDVCKAYLKDFYLQQQLAKGPVIATAGEKLSAPGVVVEYEADAFVDNIIEVSAFNKNGETFGAGGAEFLDAGFFDTSGQVLRNFRGGDRVSIRLVVRMNRDITHPAFGLTFKDRLGQAVISEGTDGAFRSANLHFGEGDIATATFSFCMPVLLQGHYSIDIAFAEGLGNDHVQHHWIHDALTVTCLRGRLIQGITGLPELEIKLDNRPGNPGEHHE